MSTIIIVHHNIHINTFAVVSIALGCPDLMAPSGAWIKRMGDNAMVKCNETLETWYLTCQRNRWIGDTGNCSQSNNYTSL